MEATQQFSPHPSCCPLCGRNVHVGRLTELFFVDCPHCSAFLTDAEAWRSLLINPLSAREVANIASYHWEECPCSGLNNGMCKLNVTNVRALGHFWRKNDHHRLFQVLLRVLYNTYERERFTLEFDDPMYLGMTASASPEELRQLVVTPRIASFLPVITDLGHGIRTCVTDQAIAIMGVPLRIGPGVGGTINLEGLRRQVA